ncbi:amino acid ABC transporter substrate-binding protein [Aerobium aerolatum]|uniref:amino acid ABC transporter substrate-binding protein n=1 Tax=Aerobium aerolatum TaxID=561088 RepID=UPI001587FA70|nr:amino acid ABC transporter substrate-binding protein [Aquamicrobium aerolatum]
MSQFISSALLAALLSFLVPCMASADVLSELARTGVLRAGTRADVAPFGFRDENNIPVGFSVDLLDRIRVAAEERLGRKIELDMTVVTPANRINKVEDGELDIICEIATPTWEREAVVDFSIPFFRDGTRVLAFRETLNNVPELKDMVIGIAEGTTTGSILEEALPGVQTLTYPSMDEAFAALRSGEINGIANVGVILLGLSRQFAADQSVVLLPRIEPLSSEAMACILPQNDSAWRDFVNATIVDLMQGLRDYRGDYMQLYDQWFGRDGVLPYPMDRSTRDYLLRGDIWAQ